MVFVIERMLRRPPFVDKCVDLLFPWPVSSWYTFFMMALYPSCRHPMSWNRNHFHPFYSERYRVVDLGAWPNAEYQVPENFQRSMSIPVEESFSKDS